MSYCPFKKNALFKTRYNGLVEYESQRIAQVDHVFGECDGSRCMAYSGGECALLKNPVAIRLTDDGDGYGYNC